MNRIKCYMVITLLFLAFWGRGLSGNVDRLQVLKNKVDSGSISTAEAMMEAKGMGYSQSDLLRMQQGSNGKAKKEIDLVEVKEAKVASNPKETNKVEKTAVVKGNSRYYGYNFFRGAPNSFSSTKTGPVNPDYQIGPGDEIVISVWGKAEFRYLKTVSRQGVIYIDNIGQVVVNGLSLEGLKKKLVNVMSRAYKSLKPASGNPGTFLDVSLGKLKTMTVYFVGEFKKPGAYQVDSYATAFSALYQVGGPTEKGTLRDIKVIRNGKEIASFDLYDFLQNGKKVDDIRLQNDDNIFVAPRLNSITIKGAIERPLVYELKKDENLADLVGYAGGLKVTTDLKRVQIERIKAFNERKAGEAVLDIVDEELTAAVSDDNTVEINPLKLYDLDQITLFSLAEDKLGYVNINGAVFRGGKYALSGNLTVNDLVAKAQGFKPEAYLKKADLIRTYLDKTTRHFSINLETAQADTFKLLDYDVLKIYSIWDWEKKPTVELRGHVPTPGNYQLHEEMRISDLLFKGGSLNDSLFRKRTHLKKASLIRFKEDGVSTFIIPIDLTKVLAGDKQYDLLLKNKDRLDVWKNPDYEKRHFVKISGEVKFPGEYLILSKKQTLSDLIEKAGGLKETAFEAGIKFYRRAEETYSDTAEFVEIEKRKIVSNFEKLLSGDTHTQLILRDGDEIVIPKHPGTVIVEGFVNNPGVVVFDENMDLENYIESVGGFRVDGEVDQVIVYFPGGNAEVDGWLSSPKVKEGSRIVVKKAPEVEPTNWVTVYKEWAAILASTLTIIYIIDQNN